MIHLLVHRPPKLNSCPQCPSKFSKEELLKKHLIDTHSALPKCPECGLKHTEAGHCLRCQEVPKLRFI